MRRQNWVMDLMFKVLWPQQLTNPQRKVSSLTVTELQAQSGGSVIWVCTPIMPLCLPTWSSTTRNTVSTRFWSRSETKTINCSQELRLETSVLSTDTTTRTMVMQFLLSIVFPDWTCWWGMQKSRRMVITQEGEIRKSHMRQCLSPDRWSQWHCFSDSQRLARLSLATHWSDLNSRTQTASKSPSLIINYNSKKSSPVSHKLLPTSLVHRKSLKWLLRCLRTPKKEEFLISWMKPMQWPVEPRQYWPMMLWEVWKFWEGLLVDMVSWWPQDCQESFKNLRQLPLMKVLFDLNFRLKHSFVSSSGQILA